MLLLSCLAALWSFQLQVSNTRELTLVQIPAVDANHDLLLAMTDAYTGLNAYQVSGDRSLLQPYFGAHSRAKSALADLTDKLERSSGGEMDAAPRNDLNAVQIRVVGQWWDNAQRVEQAQSRGERTEAFSGRALFNRFKGANAALDQYLTLDRDTSQLAARALLARGETVTVAAAGVSLLAMLILGRRVARSIGQPLADLRDTMVRQRHGEMGARAREDKGSREVRSVAGDFNALLEQNLALLQSRERALSGNQITSDIGRAIRATSDPVEALDVACAALGDALGADRVIANAYGVDRSVLLKAQWHRPDLQPVEDLNALPELADVATEMWLSGHPRTRDDLMIEELQSQARIRDFCRMTGASASIMVPIGFNDRVIGSIDVLMTGLPRQWDPSETDVARVVSGFVARAIVEAESLVHQREYVDRVERLDTQKSEFLASVSHELRTPLTSISGYVELLQDGDIGELSAQQSKMLEVIGRSADRLRGLIEDIMMLNRIEGEVAKDNFVDLSVGALIIRVTEELMPLATKRGIELEVDAGPPSAVVLGDRSSLERAVVNILSNAIKFSHRGGVVTISGTLDQEAGRVLLICQDRGLGIPERDQADLFTRFFRASNATEQAIPGTGLGLSIAKQIVEDHHDGRLRLISAEGEGTTVVIDLPSRECTGTPAVPGNDRETDSVFGIRA